MSKGNAMRLFKTIAATAAALLVSAPVLAAVNPAAGLSLAESDAQGGSDSHKGTSSGTYIAIGLGVAAIAGIAVALGSGGSDNTPASA
jgi:hypothetical protein